MFLELLHLTTAHPSKQKAIKTATVAIDKALFAFCYRIHKLWMPSNDNAHKDGFVKHILQYRRILIIVENPV